MSESDAGSDDVSDGTLYATPAGAPHGAALRGSSEDAVCKAQLGSWTFALFVEAGAALQPGRLIEWLGVE